jgi:hypothetical protein
MCVGVCVCVRARLCSCQDMTKKGIERGTEQANENVRTAY